jgi:hypothetical protein
MKRPCHQARFPRAFAALLLEVLGTRRYGRSTYFQGRDILQPLIEIKKLQSYLVILQNEPKVPLRGGQPPLPHRLDNPILRSLIEVGIHGKAESPPRQAARPPARHPRPRESPALAGDNTAASGSRWAGARRIGVLRVPRVAHGGFKVYIMGESVRAARVVYQAKPRRGRSLMSATFARSTRSKSSGS